MVAAIDRSDGMEDEAYSPDLQEEKLHRYQRTADGRLSPNRQGVGHTFSTFPCTGPGEEGLSLRCLSLRGSPFRLWLLLVESPRSHSGSGAATRLLAKPVRGRYSAPLFAEYGVLLLHKASVLSAWPVVS